MKNSSYVRYWIAAVCVIGGLSTVANAQPLDAVAPDEANKVEQIAEDAAVITSDVANTVTEVSQEAKTEISTEIVADIAEEDETPESLLPDGEEEMMASHPVGTGKIEFKPGKGLVISSSDGEFQLKTRVRVQMLYTLEKDNGQDPQHAFRMRRARFVFNGNAFGKHNKYKLEVDVLAGRPVLDYYLDFTKNRDISVRIGQYKLSSNRTRVISSGNLQMVDRSIVNAEFTLDRDVGIDIRSKDFLGKGKFKYILGVSMGEGKNNPSFQDFGMLYLARVEYLPFGMFDDYKESDLKRTQKHRLAFGAAYAFHHRAANTRGNIGIEFPDEGTADYHYGYFDSIYKYAGFSLIGEFALRMGDRDVGGVTMDENGDPVIAPAARDGLGWMLQAGYLIPRQPLEVVGRFACVRDLGDNTSLSELKELAVGFNWFIGQHPFKVQTDITQIWGDKFSDGDFRIRLQLQASL